MKLGLKAFTTEEMWICFVLSGLVHSNLFTIGYRNKDSWLLSSKLDWTVVKVGENIWRVDQEISKTLNSCWSHDWMFVSKVSKTVKTYQGQRKMSLNNLFSKVVDVTSQIGKFKWKKHKYCDRILVLIINHTVTYNW